MPVSEQFSAPPGLAGSDTHQPGIPLGQHQVRYEYRYDQFTGARHQVEIPVTPQHGVPRAIPRTAPAHLLSNSLNGSQQQYRSHLDEPPANLPWRLPHSGQRPVFQSADDTADRTIEQRIQDSVKGIVSIVETGGATKSLKLIDFAKRCPAKWSRNVKLDTMSLPLYGYAAVAEMEASLSGKSEPYSAVELLARLRHMKNVFEVCCLNSAEKDFLGYGWTLARDYSMKVMNKVAHGDTTWQGMLPGVQTADLLMAQCDYPRPTTTRFPRKEDTPADPKRDKIICTTWNSCTTEGKCEYEVSNPGRECFRKHECSWCRKNLKQGFRHQRISCKKKDASEH